MIAVLKRQRVRVDSRSMTSTPTRSPVITAQRVGPVITTLAAVLSAAVMFGFGVLVGMAIAKVFGLHDAARTATMLAAGAALSLASAVASARRHLRRGRR